MPTAAVVGVLCAAVVAEIVVLPGVLPGAAITLLAGALIAAGRPALAVAVPLALAIAAGDQLAYVSGATVTRWWRRRRRDRVERRARSGAMESWLTAAMPSLAGAAGQRYGQFAPRVLALRVPWLGAALGTGALAAAPVARLGQAIGLAGFLISGCVVAALLVFRWRARTGRRAPGQTGTLPLRSRL